MKGKLKRVVALMMTTVIVISSVIGCGSDSKETGSQAQADILTRGEWITMLSQGFGMDQYKSTEPYYADVQPDDEIFPYVQSCYEWKVLSTGTDEFKPDDVATVGFVISTAVLASELEYDQYVSGDNVNDAIITCAYENGIYDVKPGDETLNESISEGNAIIVMNAAIDAYMNKTEEEHIDVAFNDNVTNMTEVENLVASADGTVSMPQANGDTLEVGDIFYVEATVDNPSGAAYKVVSKTLNADGTYTIVTATPTFEEVFEEIDLYTVTELSEENIFPVEGVTMVANKNEASINADRASYTTGGRVDDLTSVNSNVDGTASASAKASETFTFDFDFKSKKSNVTMSDSLTGALEDIGLAFLQDAEIEYEQEETEDEDFDSFVETVKQSNAVEASKEAVKTKNEMKKLISDYNEKKIDKATLKSKVNDLAKTTQKKSASLSKCDEYSYKEGYSITGQIEVSLSAEAKVEFGWLSGFEYFSLKGNYDIVGEAAIEGKIEEELTIAKLVIPIGGVFAIEGSLKLYSEINGKLSLKVELGNEVKISYDDDTEQFKKSTTSSASATAEASVSMEFGPKAVLAISALGFDIADIALSAALLFKAESQAGIALETTTIEDENNPGREGLQTTLVFTLDSSLGAYAPIVKISVGGKGTLLNDLGISATFTLMDEENAIYKEEFDIPPYTKELYKEIVWFDEETTTEETTSEASTEEETTTVDTEVSYNNGIMFDDAVVVVAAGQSTVLHIALPEGYTAADIEWYTSEPTFATVSGGTVKALSEGHTTITAKTKDGKYSGQCVVVVE